MVNFSGSNLLFLNSETTELPEGRRNRYRTKHCFRDQHVQRTYAVSQYHDLKEEAVVFQDGTRYAVNGKVNVQGYLLFLILEGWKEDTKNARPEDALLRREVVPPPSPSGA
jgi:hypothetical protein